MDEMRVDFITSRLKVKRMVMFDDGRAREIDYSIRLYTLHELGKMLHDVRLQGHRSERATCAPRASSSAPTRRASSCSPKKRSALARASATRASVQKHGSFSVDSPDGRTGRNRTRARRRGRAACAPSRCSTSTAGSLPRCSRLQPITSPTPCSISVPAEVPPLTEVIHDGKNSLPLFSRFQKRFCRPAGPLGDTELWGYNEQAMRVFTGPGYFVAHTPEERDVIIDYSRVPTAKPRALARDSLELCAPGALHLPRDPRSVASGQSPRVRGARIRGEQPMDAWFVLVRQEPAPRR